MQGSPKIEIDPEFRRLIPPLDPEERAVLEDNLKTDGCRDPLVVWRPVLGKAPVILDGHNRFEICRRLGIRFRTTEIALASRKHARIWILLNQVGRRNLSEDRRAVIALEAYLEQAELSRDRRAEHAANVRWGKARPKKSRDLLGRDYTLREIANKFRLSPNKLRRLNQIALHDKNHEAEKGYRSLIPRIEKGELTVAAARQIMHERQIRDATARAINARRAASVSGHYDVIVVSPPWPKTKPWPMSKYESLTVPEIQAILRNTFVMHASDACHIFIWAPQRFLPMVFHTLHEAPDEIKIQYVCTFVWVRGGNEQPSTLPRWNCEFCIYARKGMPKFLDLRGLKTCFEARRDPVLEKPREFYQTIRRVTAGRRLHMFATTEVDGFESSGRRRNLTKTPGKYGLVFPRNARDARRSDTRPPRASDPHP
jgi:hypothetical protein